LPGTRMPFRPSNEPLRLLHILMVAQISNKHIRALPTVVDGNGPADAAIRPGDNCLLPLKFAAATIDVSP
jgi:hypothetical protein